jgi:hypothetical protein
MISATFGVPGALAEPPTATRWRYMRHLTQVIYFELHRHQGDMKFRFSQLQFPSSLEAVPTAGWSAVSDRRLPMHLQPQV